VSYDLKITRWRELLQDIAAGVCKLDNVRSGLLHVRLYQDGTEVLSAPLATVLGYLANDVYWNEENNWSGADRATVEVY